MKVLDQDNGLIHAGQMKTFPNYALNWVGIEDVVMAHVLAYEKDQAEGRCICLEQTIHMSDLVALLNKMHPEYHIDAE